MSGARRSDGLLDRRGFVRAVEFVRMGTCARAEIVRALQAVGSAPSERAHNTIDLLLEVGVFKAGIDGKLALSEDVEQANDLVALVRKALLDAYVPFLERVGPTNIFQAAQDGALRVHPTQLPCRERCYPYALLEFGVFARTRLADPFWTVGEESLATVMEAVRAANRIMGGRHFPLSALKAAQRAREEAGLSAERWVIDWEKERLAGHPLVDMVRSISEENASAGYDIMSFDSASGLLHDRFIEVKSYADEHSFHWSKGEIDAARTLGMHYWLYLVDRRAMDRQGYIPEMLQDPVSYLIDRVPIGWEVEATSFKFTRTTDLPLHRGDLLASGVEQG